MLAVGYTISPNNLLGAIIEIVVCIVTFVAVARIILQAGYSQLWALIPLVSFVLFVVDVIWAFTLLRSATTIEDLTSSLRLYADSLRVLNWLILVNWVLFLVFAFRTFPAVRRSDARAFALRPSSSDSSVSARSLLQPSPTPPPVPMAADAPVAESPENLSPESSTPPEDDYWARRTRQTPPNGE
jgi:hypothetical protein